MGNYLSTTNQRSRELELLAAQHAASLRRTRAAASRILNLPQLRIQSSRSGRGRQPSSAQNISQQSSPTYPVSPTVRKRQRQPSDNEVDFEPVAKRLCASSSGTLAVPTMEHDDATHTNHEGRPLQKVKNGSADGSKSFHDVQNRPGTSKSLDETSMIWTTVHASTRNAKQPLQETELNTTVKGHDSKTKQLQEQVEVLTFQNAQKDVQIEELKQHLKVKTQKGCTGTLEYAGGVCSLLHNPEGNLIILGNGSYGMVYKGCCDNTGRHLAVKVVQNLTKKAADALEKEVKQLNGLKHDRIVTYLGTCYAKHPCFDVESLYFFMEFMPGGSLSSYISEKGPLSETIMWRFTCQILEGVEYLHTCDIIHRDIKGSNIMCDSSHKNLKLADFGSAKKICSESLDKDKPKYVYGTVPWAAPEMLRGEKAQRGSDIWSVGATLVEMLTGDQPYKNENFDNKVAIIFEVGSYNTNPLISLRRSGQVVATDVEIFLENCFKKIATDRSSASDLFNLALSLSQHSEDEILTDHEV